MTIQKIHDHLNETKIFDAVELVSENELDIGTGCFYDVQKSVKDCPTEVVLRLKQEDDNLILIDKGLTRVYMDAVFELGEEDVIKNIIAITNECGVSTKNKQLSMKLGKAEEADNIDEFVDVLKASCSKLAISCIGFLSAMKIFYV